MKRHCLLMFCCLILLYGCGFLGSKAKVYDKDRLRTVNTVVVIARGRQQNVPPEIDRMLDSTFSNLIKERLTQMNRFSVDFLSKEDADDITIENNCIQTSNTIEINRYDAIVFVDRKLNWPIGMYSDSKVEISMYDVKSKELIVYVSFNTDLGKSYLSNPVLPGTLIDATNAAFNKLVEKLSQ